MISSVYSKSVWIRFRNPYDRPFSIITIETHCQTLSASDAAPAVPNCCPSATRCHNRAHVTAHCSFMVAGEFHLGSVNWRWRSPAPRWVPRVPLGGNQNQPAFLPKGRGVTRSKSFKELTNLRITTSQGETGLPERTHDILLYEFASCQRRWWAVG